MRRHNHKIKKTKHITQKYNEFYFKNILNTNEKQHIKQLSFSKKLQDLKLTFIIINIKYKPLVKTILYARLG